MVYEEADKVNLESGRHINTEIPNVPSSTVAISYRRLNKQTKIVLIYFGSGKLNTVAREAASAMREKDEATAGGRGETGGRKRRRGGGGGWEKKEELSLSLAQTDEDEQTDRQKDQQIKFVKESWKKNLASLGFD